MIKHTNPCGFATGDGPLDAYRRAHACDPRSAYGGIVALNRSLDLGTAQELAKTFLEIVICPAIDEDAAARLARRERLRVLVLRRPDCAAAYDVRSLSGGLLGADPRPRSVPRAATEGRLPARASSDCSTTKPCWAGCRSRGATGLPTEMSPTEWVPIAPSDGRPPPTRQPRVPAPLATGRRVDVRVAMSAPAPFWGFRPDVPEMRRSVPSKAGTGLGPRRNWEPTQHRETFGGRT